jgi:hypothetical protein
MSTLPQLANRPDKFARRVEPENDLAAAFTKLRDLYAPLSEQKDLSVQVPGVKDGMSAGEFPGERGTQYLCLIDPRNIGK